MLHVDQSLSDLALAQPAASRVFRELRLDFCCGGGRSLREACAERELDPVTVLDRIATVDTHVSGRDLRSLPLAELIDHLLMTFHESHRRELPDLIELAEKVERVHADKPEAPVGLAAHLVAMRRALEDHMRKEEEVLFPAILRGAGASLAMPIRVMETEHDEHGQGLRRLRELAGDFVAPVVACTSWKALLLRCEQLEADLMAHVQIENHVLFPRVLSGGE